MLILRGAPALSLFRTQKLLANLQLFVPGVTGLTAEFVHFVHSAAPLSEAQTQVLQRLLSYGPRAPIHESFPADQGDVFLVVPRLGTISPWASKATDIAKKDRKSVV